MLRELIAPAQEQVAFREYESAPLQANEIRVKSQFGAAKHGSEMASYKGYAGPRGGYDSEYKYLSSKHLRNGALSFRTWEHVCWRSNRGWIGRYRI